MTLRELIESDVAAVFLNTEDFAEQITRYIGGDDGNVQTMTAIVEIDQPTFEKSRGRGYETRATVMVEDAVTVATGDAFLIRSERYEVLTVKPVEHGAREVTCVRYASEARGVRTAGDI
jgi:hypothetical protein